LGAAVLLGALLVGFLPSVASAHYADPGINGAQIDVLATNNADTGLFPAPQYVTVKGIHFIPNSAVQIFECQAGAVDLHSECVPAGAAVSDGSGSFNTDAGSTSPGRAAVSITFRDSLCKSIGPTQCEVAAATYDPVTSQPTSQAAHAICFYAQAPLTEVAPCSQHMGTTTTTAAPPPEPEWQAAPPMAVAREQLATAVGNDGRIYALGGNAGDGTPLNSAEAFDPCTHRWTVLRNMQTPRTEFAAAGGSDGRIYAIGGRDRAQGTPLSTVEAYDPLTDAWSFVGSLAVPRADLAATRGPDGRIYAIGGIVGPSTAPTAVATVEVLDPTTYQWALGAPLSYPRYGHGAASPGDGHMYVLGGMGELRPNPLTPVERYTPGTSGAPGTWQPTSTAPAFLSPNLAVAAGGDGRIYAAGGTDSGTTASRTVHDYQPATDTWTIRAEGLSTPRTLLGAADGRDGRVYALGGATDLSNLNGPTLLASVESLQVGPNLCPRLTEPADFDGNFTTDFSVFRPASGAWYVQGGASLGWGAPGDIAVPADYDGDHHTDEAIFRPSTGLWAIHPSGGGADVFVTYGVGSDIPVVADYDGDGRADIAIWRPDTGTWWIHRSSDGADVAVTFGISGDVAVPGDYDGDGKADLGIFRSGTWFTHSLVTGTDTATSYGAPGDVPVPADYDGDMTTDLAVYRPSTGTWFLHHSSDSSDEAFGFGTGTDIPEPGDYNGDRIADPAVFRPSSGQWFVETGETTSWGVGTDVALPLPPAVRLAFYGGP
jgi:hypothetical protein